MPTCERCGSRHAAWFTPSRFGRQAGVFQCQDFGKVNVSLPGRPSRMEAVPVRGGARFSPRRRCG